MTFQAPFPQDTAPSADDEAGIDLLELAAVLSLRWKLVAGTALLGGLAAMGFSFLITPTFTAQTVVMPPQQQQSAAASALASLGGLAGMAGLGGIKSPGEQYVSLLRTNAIEDRLIERFKLMDVYKAKIKDEIYLVLPDGRSTLCILTLENGYSVKGISACVDPAEFDMQLGREYALKDAMNQVWPLEGYLLAEKLYRERAIPVATNPPKKVHWTQTPEGKKILAKRKPRGKAK